MPTHPQTTSTVAIIGGGVSGALAAWHLRRSAPKLRIVILEPRPWLGLGLAYSTPSLRHLLNVPAGKLSALPNEPDHFLHWLRAHHDPGATPGDFAPRAVYGRYIQSLLADTPSIEHIQSAVRDLRQTSGIAELSLADGSVLQADRVILATGNFDPAPLPGVSPASIDTGVYCHNAWDTRTCADLPAEAPVALIGSGLTAVDVLLRLRELGHHGPVTAISRHGIFPNPHAPYTPAPNPAIPATTRPTCLHYLRALRASIASGTEWRAAIDSLRPVTNPLWLALPLKEQRRFRRHLQRRWDVLRHRMAPAIAAVLQAELAAGTLRTLQGHVAAIDAHSDGALLTLRTAGGAPTHPAARVINCTGPAADYRRIQSPLLSSLFAQGLAAPGPLGNGLLTTPDGALVDAQGHASAMLFTLGPSRQGTLLESIAIPELREQAAALAVLLAAKAPPAGQTAAA